MAAVGEVAAARGERAAEARPRSAGAQPPRDLHGAGRGPVPVPVVLGLGPDRFGVGCGGRVGRRVDRAGDAALGAVAHRLRAPHRVLVRHRRLLPRARRVGHHARSSDDRHHAAAAPSVGRGPSVPGRSRPCARRRRVGGSLAAPRGLDRMAGVGAVADRTADAWSSIPGSRGWTTRRAGTRRCAPSPPRAIRISPGATWRPWRRSTGPPTSTTGGTSGSWPSSAPLAGTPSSRSRRARSRSRTSPSPRSRRVLRPIWRRPHPTSVRIPSGCWRSPTTRARPSAGCGTTTPDGSAPTTSRAASSSDPSPRPGWSRSGRAESKQRGSIGWSSTWRSGRNASHAWWSPAIRRRPSSSPLATGEGRCGCSSIGWWPTGWRAQVVPTAPSRCARSTLALVEREGFSEYYDAATGEGIGGRSFSWSAALTLAWLER